MTDRMAVVIVDVPFICFLSVSFSQSLSPVGYGSTCHGGSLFMNNPFYHSISYVRNGRERQ